MYIAGHGDSKYRTGRRLAEAVDYNALRVELWRHEAGVQSDLTLEFTEVVILLNGQLRVKRTGNGERQDTVGRPGTVWLCPAGTHESDIDLSATMLECVHLYLPPTLLERSALEDHDLDPDRINLGYLGGFSDQMMSQIALNFRNLVTQPQSPTDRLLVDGMRTFLAAHLIRQYTARPLRSESAARQLDERRLKRVLDYIEANLSNEIVLEDLAAQACLSSFHFLRLFRQTIGLTPYRYVMQRRVESAKQQLAIGRSSLVEIALDNGFGSQANFNRVFKRATGISPGQYRSTGL